MKKNMKKGFTLVEMMIVVAIIAVLAGVAIPQYAKYIKKSETVEGITLMRQIADAEILYHTTNNEYLEFNSETGSQNEDILQAKLFVTLPAGAKFASYEVEKCDTQGGFRITSWTGGTATASDMTKAIFMVYPKRTVDSVTFSSVIDNYVNGTTVAAPVCN